VSSSDDRRCAFADVVSPIASLSVTGPDCQIDLATDKTRRMALVGRLRFRALYRLPLMLFLMGACARNAIISLSVPPPNPPPPHTLYHPPPPLKDVW
jgi:hypothetical protein